MHILFKRYLQSALQNNKIDPNQKESLQELVSVLNIYLYVDSVHILGLFCSCSCGFSTVFVCCCVYVLCGNMLKRSDYCFYFPFCWQQKTSYENTCLFNKLSKCLMCKFVFQACKQNAISYSTSVCQSFDLSPMFFFFIYVQFSLMYISFLP